jgi:DNA gyrase inhibitor GyrI
MDKELDVAVRDLPAVRVVVLEYRARGFAGTYQESIGELFRELEGWLKVHGIYTHGLRRIGVPFADGDQLQRYWCCIEAPAGGVAEDGEVTVRELAAGRYAVLTLTKDANTIGANIGRFYRSYVPAHQLTLDATRPPYEVYHPNTMEYCVPLQ